VGKGKLLGIPKGGFLSLGFRGEQSIIKIEKWQLQHKAWVGGLGTIWAGDGILNGDIDYVPIT